jgi:hypothetical protein
MKNKPYSVVGDQKQGFRIAVPTDTGIKAGDKFACTLYDEPTITTIPRGALLYVPAKRE